MSVKPITADSLLLASIEQFPLSPSNKRLFVEVMRSYGNLRVAEADIERLERIIKS